jgi:hypothetical protein
VRTARRVPAQRVPARRVTARRVPMVPAGPVAEAGVVSAVAPGSRRPRPEPGAARRPRTVEPAWSPGAAGTEQDRWRGGGHGGAAPLRAGEVAPAPAPAPAVRRPTGHRVAGAVPAGLAAGAPRTAPWVQAWRGYRAGVGRGADGPGGTDGATGSAAVGAGAERPGAVGGRGAPPAGHGRPGPRRRRRGRGGRRRGRPRRPDRRTAPGRSSEPWWCRGRPESSTHPGGAGATGVRLRGSSMDQRGRKSSSSRLMASGCSSCIQWPGPSRRS